MVRRLFALRAPCVVTPEVGSLFATGQIVKGGVRRSRPSSAGASVNHLHARAAGDTGASSPTIISSSSSLTTGGFALDRQDDRTSLHPKPSRRLQNFSISGCRQFSSSSSTSRSSLIGAEDIKQMKNEITIGCSRMTPRGADDANQLLRQLIEDQVAGNKLVGVDAELINGLLNSHRVLSERAAEKARKGKRRPDATFAKKADDLLAFAEQACAKDPALSPDSKSYSMVVDAYAKIGDPEHAEAVLLRLEKLWKSGNEKVKPNTILYNSVIDGWAKSGRRDAPKRAEAILQHMEQLSDQGHAGVRPNTISYSSVINAWAKSREKGAAERAETILNHMLKLQEDGREECRPNTTSFTTVIDAWARSKDRNAPQRAEAFIHKMEELYQRGDTDVRPNTVSYNAVTNAWAKSREKGAAQRAEAILNHMLKLHEGGREECCPNTRSFNTVIDAWAKSRDSAAPQRAEALLKKMEELYREGSADVCPNTVSYNAVMNAWAKSREKGAAQRAEAILNHMLKLHEGGREECCPNTRSFNTVIDAWAKSRDSAAPQRAEALLKKMEELYREGSADVCPNTVSYNAVMNAWAKSREKGAAQRAEAILNHMLKLNEGGREECRPNSISFTAVIDAWAKSGDKNAYEHASKLFQQMQSMGKAAEPNSVTHNSLINALAVSYVPDKATKALDILLEMENMANKGNRDVAPTIITYSAVVKACARAPGNREAKRKALRVALETFDKLRRTSQLASADPMVYDPLFITIANTSKGKEYAKLVTEIFKFCCEDGVLNDYILGNLRRNSPRDVFENLVGRRASGRGDVSVKDLPPEWSRNAKMRR